MVTQDEWRTNVDSRLTRIEEELHQFRTANAVDEVHRNNIEGRLTAIEDTLKWLVRLILGAIILAAVGFALSGGFNVS